jgi:hypothetical protein
MLWWTMGLEESYKTVQDTLCLELVTILKIPLSSC